MRTRHERSPRQETSSVLAFAERHFSVVRSSDLPATVAYLVGLTNRLWHSLSIGVQRHPIKKIAVTRTPPTSCSRQLRSWESPVSNSACRGFSQLLSITGGNINTFELVYARNFHVHMEKHVLCSAHVHWRGQFFATRYSKFPQYLYSDNNV